jgi:hypothetical protein
MNPKEFMKFSERLLNDHSSYPGDMSEGMCRTVIDRYYYYVFLTLRSCLESLGYNISRKAEAHKEVMEHVDNLFGVGNLFTTLRFTRDDATYDLNKRYTLKEATLFKAKVEKFISTVTSNPNYKSFSDCL